MDESSLEIHTDTLSPEMAKSAESTVLLGVAPSAGSKSAEKISSPFVIVVAAAAVSSLVLEKKN